MSFRPFSDSQLQCLSDEALVDYVAQAFTARADAAAGRALGLLAWGHEPWIVRQVSKKIPREHVEGVVDAVIDSAGVAALEGKARFAGTTHRAYRGWLKTIIARRIADFWRSPLRDVTRVRIAEEVGADENVRGEQLIQRDDTQAVMARLQVDDELSNLRPDHAEAMRLVELEGFSASEAAERIPGMTPANVWKIRERFGRSIRDHGVAG